MAVDRMNNRTSQTAQRLTRIVLGVTGGIAAYKAAELMRLLVKDGVTVDVVMTDGGDAIRHADDVPGAVRPCRC